MTKLPLLSALSGALVLALVSTSAVAGNHHRYDNSVPAVQGFENSPAMQQVGNVPMYTEGQRRGTEVATIAQVRAYGYEDQKVILKGKLTNVLGRQLYQFVDETGDITVKLDDDQDWSHISKDQLITIYGEVDHGRYGLKIDVDYAKAE